MVPLPRLAKLEARGPTFIGPIDLCTWLWTMLYKVILKNKPKTSFASMFRISILYILNIY